MTGEDKGSVRVWRGSRDPGCEMRREREEVSDLIDAVCLLFVGGDRRETICP